MDLSSGRYSECTLDASGPAAAYRVWSSLEEWEICRWLAPGAQLASRVYEVKGRPPADLVSPDRFFLEHRITTLLPITDARRAPALGGLLGAYLDRNGQWLHP